VRRQIPSVIERPFRSGLMLAPGAIIWLLDHPCDFAALNHLGDSET